MTRIESMEGLQVKLKTLEAEMKKKTKIMVCDPYLICLFVLRLNVPVNNFSVMSRRRPPTPLFESSTNLERIFVASVKTRCRKRCYILWWLLVLDLHGMLWYRIPLLPCHESGFELMKE